MNTPPPSSIPILGWREWCALPDLGIPHIKAKIDTGARTSALHTRDLELYDAPGGQNRVRFTVQPYQGDDQTLFECDCAVISQRSVRDSGGHEQVRPFICVPIQLGPHRWEAEISLTCRVQMKFRMLLGRTAMADRFLVNPALSFQQSEPPTPKA